MHWPKNTATCFMVVVFFRIGKMYLGNKGKCQAINVQLINCHILRKI